MSDRIDMAWIRDHGGRMFEMHLNMGDQHRLAYHVVDRHTGQRTGISFTDISYKRGKRNGAKAGTCERIWFVDGHPAEIATLEEAVDILRITRIGDEAASLGTAHA